MVRGPAPWLLALLLLAPAAAPGLGLAAAQGNATAPPASPPPAAAPPAGSPAPPAATPFTALPPELLAVGYRWLDDANASIAAFQAAHPGNDTTVLRLFRDGAWDFLNESRLGLAQSQLFQVHVHLTYQGFFPGLAEEQRREASIAKSREELNRSQAALGAFMARLRTVDAALRTTHGLEYATLAAGAAVVADQLARSGANATDQLAQAPAAEERIVRAVLAVTAGPQAYVRMAGGLLDLAERVDASPGRPALPGNASAVLRAKIVQRLALDPDAGSTTGPLSSEGLALLDEAAQSGIASLHLARFMAFEQARAADALDFKQQRNTLPLLVLSSNLRSVTDNATWLPRYDGSLDRHEGTPLAEQLRAAGYNNVFAANARNHATYRLTWDIDDNGNARYEGAKAAWGEALAARYAAETLREVPTPKAAGGLGGDLLLYGGIAVAAAVTVIAVAMLRKPTAKP